MPIKKRVLSDTVQRYTIWDNFARHVQELTVIGVAEADLEPLRAAAENVDKVEGQEAMEQGRNPSLENRDLAELSGPYTCANGWVIAAPTALARRYAVAAALRITGGDAPVDAVSSGAVIAAGLFVLREWGEGKRDRVMSLVYGPGALAAIMPDLVSSSRINELVDDLADDYMIIMGFWSQKKTAAMLAYRERLLAIRKRYCAISTGGS